MKRVTQLSNLLELIKNKTIIVEIVIGEVLAGMDITEQDTVVIAPTEFVKSIQHLNDAMLFRDVIDFYYEFYKGKLLIKVVLKNLHMKTMYVVECCIKKGVKTDDVEAKLRKTIFDNC